MKKICLLVTVVTVVALLAIPSTAMAVKPTLNLAAAQVVPWNLSGAVMPPPCGSADIPGSATASKLIVNQPNGNTEVAITGVMQGLAPLTTYTVLLSNGYTPFKETGWDVTGNYTISLVWTGYGTYTEYLVLAQASDGSITGTYLAMDAAGTSSRWNIDSGAVVGDQLTFRAHYENNLTQLADFSATIAADGSLVDGKWADVGWNTRKGTWASTVGHATKTYCGDNAWPGLFTPTVQPFTFTTDEFGAASWHLNLKDADFPGTGTYPLSVWIQTGWDLSGHWLFNYWFNNGTAPADYHMSLTQVGDALSGRGDYPYPADNQYGWPLTSGSVVGDTMSFTSVYDKGSEAIGTVMHTSGTIAPDGTITGVWDDNYLGGYRAGTWRSVSGAAKKHFILISDTFTVVR